MWQDWPSSNGPHLQALEVPSGWLVVFRGHPERIVFVLDTDHLCRNAQITWQDLLLQGGPPLRVASIACGQLYHYAGEWCSLAYAYAP